MLKAGTKKDESTTSQIKSNEPKNYNSVLSLISPKANYFSIKQQKNIFFNHTSSHRSNKTMNYNYISTTPKVKNKSSFSNLKLNNLDYIAYSAKNANKQSINYSATVNDSKRQLNCLTLFPIQEQIMKLSNGLNINQKTIDTHLHQLNNKERKSTLTGSIFHCSNKSLKIKRHPNHCSDSNTNTNTNTKASTAITKKYHPHTSQNVSNSINERINTVETTRSKKEFSLKKIANTIHKDIGIHQYYYKHLRNNSISQSYIRNKAPNINITSSCNYPKPFVKISTKESNGCKIIKQNRLLKQEAISHSNTNNNNSNGVNTNSNTNNNETKIISALDFAKDKCLIHNSTQHSFPISNKIQLSLDYSTTDLSFQKEKPQIKVNRKQESNSNNDNESNSNSNNEVKKSYYKNTTIIKKYSECLSQYEINELKGFNHPIFYSYPLEIRLKNKVKEINDINTTYSYNHFPNFIYCSNNLLKSKSYRAFNHSYLESECNDYNDEEGNYILIPSDHILYRYEIIESLGKGSFGEAIKCFDHKTKEFVCIKMIKANRKLSLLAMSEVKILKQLQRNDKDNEANIVKFDSHFLFRNHLCIVFELLDINLYEHLKLNRYAGFDVKRIKQFAIDILFTLLYLKRQKIIHCDLKPENILLCSGGDHVKVIDFGSSCLIWDKVYSYIQSRFYRAPEILLEQGYNYEIDIWSLGCILPELYAGVPIFPGEDEKDQLVCIINYLGMPSSEYLNKGRKRFNLSDSKFQLTSQPNNKSKGNFKILKNKTIASFLKGSPILFQDFVKKCLQWMPKDRMTPDEALMHEWIIKDMSKAQLQLHQRKIKRIKIGSCQGRQVNSVNSNSNGNSNSNCNENTDRRPNTLDYRSQSTHRNIRSMTHANIEIKQLSNRTRSKDLSKKPLTIKNNKFKNTKCISMY